MKCFDVKVKKNVSSKDSFSLEHGKAMRSSCVTLPVSEGRHTCQDLYMIPLLLLRNVFLSEVMEETSLFMNRVFFNLLFEIFVISLYLIYLKKIAFGLCCIKIEIEC